MGEARRREQFGLQNAAVRPQAGMQYQVDLTKATQLACACGCRHFTPVATVYTISAIVSPTGQEMTAQVPVLICMECKTPLPLGNEKK